MIFFCRKICIYHFFCITLQRIYGNVESGCKNATKGNDDNGRKNATKENDDNGRKNAAKVHNDSREGQQNVKYNKQKKAIHR